MKIMELNSVKEIIGDEVFLYTLSLEPLGSRPLNPEELDQRAREAIAETARLERQALRKAIRAIIEDVKTERDRVQTILDTNNSLINASPAAHINSNARATKRLCAAVIDIAKLLKD